MSKILFLQEIALFIVFIFKHIQGHLMPRKSTTDSVLFGE